MSLEQKLKKLIFENLFFHFFAFSGKFFHSSATLLLHNLKEDASTEKMAAGELEKTNFTGETFQLKMRSFFRNLSKKKEKSVFRYKKITAYLKRNKLYFHQTS